MVLNSVLKLFVGDKHARERKRLWPIVEEINALAESFAELSDEEIQAKTAFVSEEETHKAVAATFLGGISKVYLSEICELKVTDLKDFRAQLEEAMPECKELGE